LANFNSATNAGNHRCGGKLLGRFLLEAGKKGLRHRWNAWVTGTRDQAKLEFAQRVTIGKFVTRICRRAWKAWRENGMGKSVSGRNAEVGLDITNRLLFRRRTGQLVRAWNVWICTVRALEKKEIVCRRVVLRMVKAELRLNWARLMRKCWLKKWSEQRSEFTSRAKKILLKRAGTERSERAFWKTSMRATAKLTIYYSTQFASHLLRSAQSFKLEIRTSGGGSRFGRAWSRRWTLNARGERQTSC